LPHDTPTPLNILEWPDLQRVVDAWVTLDPETRARILALVDDALSRVQNCAGRDEEALP
jgi:hypothetical protein